ncbi:SPFH domain-containing protein [Desulfobacula toluolica]|uniref:Putative inner membrane protein, band 7 family n=1 Tax=Desulfobacula toluolica (strain DSM 7467 / Tol2) TaxID=651182 RepID=K0NE81_DESTT|nr:SPFH domain-containing protein [Desulfobacula toluolica]CCK79145.1 putative inner membrane protein, band 7 family [Desulfobacula toluolica Tol2]
MINIQPDNLSIYMKQIKEGGGKLSKFLRPGKALKILLVLAAIAYLCFAFLFVYVQPDEYGIKVVRVGLNRGVQKQIYHAGLTFVMPFGLQQMYRLPKGIQVLELTNFPETAAGGARKDRAAHIQTSDGFFVDVDVSMLYHIKDPYLVFTTIGPGTLYEDNGIIPKAEPALKETLGKLTTEEFYNSPMRVKKAEEAKYQLNMELNLKGIEVDQVLVRYFKYSPEIQKNIEAKKLQDQMVFTNRAAARAAKEEAQLKKIVQEGMVIAAVEMENGKAYVTRKIAEKDLYVRSIKANADLLVKLAEAERVRLKNAALKGIGSDRMVGLKMAQAYKGLDLIILPSDGAHGVNPLDLNNTLQLFDVRKRGEK